MAKNAIFPTSAKVLSVDFHPTKPWILASLESGIIYIWNYETRALVNSLQVTDSPVRTAKFIARKNWIVCGSDDMHIYVYDYGTWKRVCEFVAHEYLIRCVTVHATLPYVLSASDDKLIKRWDWEKNWACSMIYRGHSDHVMYIAFSPKEDTNNFASASKDCTAKVWSIDSPDPKFSWDAHPLGINCGNYLGDGADKQQFITGSNDCTAKVWEWVRWDYRPITPVHTLIGHTGKVTAACKHPKLQLLITASADETVRLWDFFPPDRPVRILRFGLGGVWGIASKEGYKGAAFGCDKGVVIVFDLENPEASASA